VESRKAETKMEEKETIRGEAREGGGGGEGGGGRGKPRAGGKVNSGGGEIGW